MPESPAEPATSARRLRSAAALAVVTAVLGVLAAAAESWRFALLLAGRTTVLSGREVRASDALVTSAGLALMVVAVATAAVAVPLLVRLHAEVARRAGRAPSRRPGEVAGWLLTPLGNLYGAGVIVGEIDALLSGPPGIRPAGGGARPSRPVVLWWSAWALNGLLVLAAAVRGLGGDVQSVADTVELHVAVDLSAAAVAGLGAAVLTRWARRLTPPRPPRPGWRVAPPAPTRPTTDGARARVAAGGSPGPAAAAVSGSPAAPGGAPGSG